ncbi:hypothetical protein ASZ90_015865 [hydrocarbon metagenome]|uniref:Uncharacterized protein n=1 Tax=hydrocarbon metagenome TaxID=938273 RepID=A0A0W8F0Q9_9ZZZZ
MGHLLEAMKLDDALKTPYARQPNPFFTFLKDSCDQITQKVLAGDLDDAETLLKDTKKTWDTWNRQKNGWIDAGKNFEDFFEFLEKREASFLSDPAIPETIRGSSKRVRYLKEMQEFITTEFGKLHDADKPDTFKSMLGDQSVKEQRFGAIFTSMKGLVTTCGSVTSCPPCNLDDLWTRFMNQPLHSDLSSLENDLKTRNDEINKCDKIMAIAGLEIPPEKQPLKPFEITPTPSPGLREQVYDLARLRLQFYRIGSFVVTLVILVSIGYSQLYLEDPTFGSPGNYATLALWGLLAGSFSEALVRKTGTATFGVE